MAQTDTTLRALVDLRDRQIQKARIQFGNRLDAIMREADEANGLQYELARKYYAIFSDLEAEITADVARIVSGYPIYGELAALRGVGPTLAAKLIALIGAIDQFDTVSKLWRFAGYAVIDGQREYRTAGEEAHYSTRLKTAVYLVGTSFLRASSPYRAVYDRAKARYEETRPEWTPMHRHRAAMRKMVKLFLAHVWERWRTLEGLPIRRAYVHEYLGHPTVEPPEAYGWGLAVPPPAGANGTNGRPALPTAGARRRRGRANGQAGPPEAPAAEGAGTVTAGEPGGA